MAQDGDTITYTYSDGTSVSEDVSGIDEITIDYIRGSGGGTVDFETGYPGGLVENVVVDVSSYNNIYIWVGGLGTVPNGRYGSEELGGGSSEISFVNTDSSDSDDEPFIAGAGGGHSVTAFSGDINQGARGGDGINEGTPPPQGGGETTISDGAVSNIPEVVDSGTTTEEGGNGEDQNGEIQISYVSTLSPPDPPSNLNASVQ